MTLSELVDQLQKAVQAGAGQWPVKVVDDLGWMDLRSIGFDGVDRVILLGAHNIYPSADLEDAPVHDLNELIV